MNKKWAGYSDLPEQESNVESRERGGLSIEQRQNAIAQVTGGGMINYNGFELRKIGLVAPNQYSAQDLDAIGQLLGGISDSLQLMLGDLANLYPDQRHKYRHLSEVTGYAEKSLRNYAHVANAVHISIRQDSLTYAHYEAVAALPYEVQVEALRVASHEGYTKPQMMRYLIERGLLKPPKKLSANVFDDLPDIAKRQLSQAKKLPPDDRMKLAAFFAELSRQIADLK